MSLTIGHRGTDTGDKQIAHTELVGEVRRRLAALPGAADLVIGHVLCAEPLAVMALRLRIPLTEAPGLLRRSMELLRPVLAGTEFDDRA